MKYAIVFRPLFWIWKVIPRITDDWNIMPYLGTFVLTERKACKNLFSSMSWDEDFPFQIVHWKIWKKTIIYWDCYRLKLWIHCRWYESISSKYWPLVKLDFCGIWIFKNYVYIELSSNSLWTFCHSSVESVDVRISALNIQIYMFQYYNRDKNETKINRFDEKSLMVWYHVTVMASTSIFHELSE